VQRKELSFYKIDDVINLPKLGQTGEVWQGFSNAKISIDRNSNEGKDFLITNSCNGI